MTGIIDNQGFFQIRSYQSCDQKTKIVVVPRHHPLLERNDYSIIFNPNETSIPILKARLAQLGVNVQTIDQADLNQDGFINSDAELKCLDQLLENDRTYIEQKISEDGMNLRYAGKYQSDKEVVLSAVRQNGNALQFASDALRRDYRVIFAAISEDPLAFRYVHSERYEDRYFNLTMAQSLNSVYMAINPRFYQDADFMLQLIRRRPTAATVLPQALIENKNFMIQLAKEAPYSLRYVAGMIPLDLFSKLIETNLQLIRTLPHRYLSHPDYQKIIFEQSFVSYRYFKNPDPAITKRYDSIRLKLRRLDIVHWDRLVSLNPHEMEMLIHNRLEANSNRPIALMIYPKYDNNRAFAINNHIKKLLNSGYQLIYMEAEDDEAFYAALKQYGEARGISLLVIGGHGDGNSINFGTAQAYSLQQERYFLDASDISEMKSKKIGRYFASDAVVVLDSCKAGLGRNNNEMNPANLLKRVLPGIPVYASTETIHEVVYYFNHKRLLADVSFSSGYHSIYRTQ